MNGVVYHLNNPTSEFLDSLPPEEERNIISLAIKEKTKNCTIQTTKDKDQRKQNEDIVEKR